MQAAATLKTLRRLSPVMNLIIRPKACSTSYPHSMFFETWHH